MGSRYEVVYPARGRQLFDGGLNNKFERSIINENESPDCLNVVFSNGAVGTRGGSTQLNTTAVGSFVCDGLYTRRDDTTAETMVAFFGGTMWQLGTTTFTTIASAQSVFTAGQRVAAAQYQNYMFIGNGGVTPYKYNGAFTRHGVPEATGVVSVVCGGAGNLAAGTYSWRVTYVNSAAVEGDVGTAVTLTLTGSGLVAVTDIPVAPVSHGVAQRRVYRTAVGGTTYKLVTTIADNTTTTYNDQIPDVSLGATAPTDQGEPPQYSVICYHQNRLFCDDATNKNFLWYSELAEPFTFKATNFIRIGDEASDLIQSISVYQNNIVVGCENSTWIIYMPSTDSADWQSIRITSAFGTKSPFAPFLYQDKLLFAAIAGSTIDPSATALDMMVAGGELKSEHIEPDMFEVQDSYVRNMSSMVFKNKGYIALTYGSGATTNNRVYVFDFSISNLSKKQGYTWTPFSGISAAQFTVYDGKLYYGTSTANGFVYEFITDSYADNGSAINSYFWTKEFSGLPGHENFIKDFRKVKLLADLAGNYYMSLSYRVDSDQGVGTVQQIDLTPGNSVWNTMRWGVDSWGSGKAQYEFEVPLGQTFGKRIQFKFSNQNTASQRFKVHGLNFTYNIRGAT
jgi:hypothetical protein